jgi:amino acid transporter
VVGMALIIVAQGGKDGLTLHPLSPTASPHGFNGLVTGFVFAALSFVGFEAAATLGEEVRRPKRNVPWAVFLSVLFVGLIYVFCIWAEVVGLGVDATNKMDGTATPWNDLAATYAPWMKLFVILASVSSMFAVMLNSNNGIVRVLHVMGREGLLPRALAKINHKRGVPVNAVLVQGIFSIVLAYVVGALAGGLTSTTGGSNVYGYLGFLLTLGVLPVYILTNVAAIRFFGKEGGFNWLRHGVLPGLAVLLVGGLLIGQIVEQTAAPYTWFPVVIIVWVVLVAAAGIWLGIRRPQTLAVAGAVLATGDAEEGRVVAHEEDVR